MRECVRSGRDVVVTERGPRGQRERVEDEWECVGVESGESEE